MSVKIYRHSGAHAIFIEDANGVQFLNSLQASVDNVTCSITDLAKNIELVSDTPYGDFVDENDAVYGNTSVEVCDALNAMFQNSGTPTASLPDITSPLTISLVQGETLNYELIAANGVAYEWDFSNVSSVANVEGNTRKIIGGASLAVGTYNIPVKAINYNGEESETIVLTVSAPSFANTKSIQFDNLDYLSANAGTVQGILARASNGSGGSDAWSVSMWVKPSGTQNNQTLFFYGGDDNNNEGHIWFRYYGGSAFEGVQLEYGTSNNNLRMLMPSQSLPLGQWTHLLVTYDGGTTGSSSGNMSTYYSRFKFYANGSLVTTSDTHQNFGYSGSIKSEVFQIGKKGLSTSYIRGNGKLDEVALFDSDQSGNASTIYNSGSPFDLSSLTNDPLHWWRMGDGDTYPTLQDSGSAANCDLTMNNMTAANIVSDIPT